jgi:hypothetical protein
VKEGLVNIREFSARLKLHPRAVILQGRIKFRVKNAGGLPGLTPHYAMPECPIVQYVGANVVEEPNAAEIEFQLLENEFPLSSALLPFSQKAGNLVQLIYGQRGKGPTQGAYRVLREAAAAFGRIGERGEVFLVAFPILTPDKFGINSGRFYFLGMWAVDGTPIYLNPDAVDGKVFLAPYPTEQKERMATNAPAVAAAAVWYNAVSSALRATGLKGQKLHQAVLKARARQLVEEGTAPSLEAGLAMAETEAPKTPQEAQSGASTAQGPTGAATTAQTDSQDVKASRQRAGARARGREA